MYKVAQRLFTVPSEWNLGRDKKERYRIRRKAWKRFILGYPPRKDDETSIGDAINWEWIIDCANRSGCNVVIVTRDSDYGPRFDKKPMVNDWLLQEFRERVTKKRKLLLTDRLSVGLRAASITVTKQEEKSEAEFLNQRPLTGTPSLPPKGASAAVWRDYLLRSGQLRGVGGLMSTAQLYAPTVEQELPSVAAPEESPLDIDD